MGNVLWLIFMLGEILERVKHIRWHPKLVKNNLWARVKGSLKSRTDIFEDICPKFSHFYNPVFGTQTTICLQAQFTTLPQQVTCDSPVEAIVSSQIHLTFISYYGL